MKQVTLGRTGLRATIAGLGCGGFSRIGIAKYGLDHAANIVRTAFDEGVNFFDTATVYGTQEAVGNGLNGIPRDQYILSTKLPYNDKTPEELAEMLDESLRLLKTDYVDIYHLHGVSPKDYEQTRDRLVPAMQKAKEQGKIRFLGITEQFAADTSHQMFQKCLPDDLFDVIMVGHNFLNPSAGNYVLPTAKEKNVGVLCMFAVREALSKPDVLRRVVQNMLNAGQADPSLVSLEDTLAFLTENGEAASVMEAAYRYCSHTDGLDVILTGTSSAAHLKDNLRSIQLPALSENVLQRLQAMFGNVDCVSGQ
jgi:aryl-alcohol dehydrogenase-like predicted oxidoreductase